MAIIATFFYFAAIPIKIALYVHIGRRFGCGMGIMPFEGRFARRRAMQRALGEKEHLPWRRTELKIDRTSAQAAVWRAGKYMLKHMCLERLCAQGQVGGGDAARIALICGCTSAIEGILSPFIPTERLTLRLKANFSMEESDIYLSGMVSIRLGHIISAALIGAWHYLARRIKHGKTSH